MINDDCLNKISVLMVDDDPDIVQAFRRMLEKIVGRVYTAANGKEAFDMAKIHNPDVVITDIEMPIMNGLKLLDEIKNWCESKTVIIVTAFEDEAIKARRADAVIIKPVIRKKLVDTLLQTVCLPEK